ncbi:MAG TPA: DUF2158 domain-containing protein [Candidatus Binatia bacterium]|nr:DUF2158 domain-containing protein [Candidatus Binatia bacterium]
MFAHLPRNAQCDYCFAIISLSASRADILSVSLFCGALAGALDATIRALIADCIAHGDPSPLLDLVEQRGLHEGGYGPERYEEWPEVTEHVHVWLPGEYTITWPDGRGAQMRRCPCGKYEHEELHSLGRLLLREFQHMINGPARQRLQGETMSEKTIEVQTTDDARPFREGDVVQLKSGGPAMTFREYAQNGQVRVQFMTRDGMKYDTLPMTMIMFARADARPGEAN